LLSGIKEKIGVIAVAGKYRTGKSFLLNRILLNKKDSCGFGVGPTINPCTKVFKFQMLNLKLIIGLMDME
jgi:predicted GTPase